MLKGPPSLFRVWFDLLADGFHIRFEIFQQHALAIEKSGKRTVGIELGEMTFEDHPIKCGERTNDVALVYTSEMFPWPVRDIMRGGRGLRSRFSILNYATMTGHLPLWLRLEAALWIPQSDFVRQPQYY